MLLIQELRADRINHPGGRGYQEIDLIRPDAKILIRAIEGYLGSAVLAALQYQEPVESIIARITD